MRTHEQSRILLIDDDTSLLVTLRDFLTFEGYQVVTAASGEEGLEKLATLAPDLIILDMSMPGMGGMGFLRKISSPEGHPAHPVLVLTARASMAEFFAHVDVDGFVAKPCEPEDLLMEVSRIIFLRRGTGKQGWTAPDEGVQRKVLLADYDEGARRELSEALGAAGHLVGAVERGPEVIEKAILERPDALVLRFGLTGMGGDAVARMLAEMPNTRNIPVVIYDAPAGSPARSEAAGTGVRRYLTGAATERILEAVAEVLV